MEFVLTKKARSDLIAIAIYTQKQWSREQRNIYLKQLDDAFHALTNNPQAGKCCDYIRTGYRKLPQGSHVIFYRQLNTAMIEIVRILHKQMDVSSKFNPEP